MAATAINRGIYVSLIVLSRVTGLAIDYGVDAGEGEAFGRMLLEKVAPSLPVLWGVAVLAIESELTFVMIGVAIDAGSPDMAENRIFVATGTLGDRVPTDQMIAGLVMLKIHCLVQRRP